MDINWVAVAAATAGQFVVGAIWYSALFGKIWGQIHGFDKLSKEVQKEMMSKMGPFYGAQLIITIVSAAALDKFLVMLPNESPYMIAFWIWLGFIVPTQIADVLFGGTEPKWMLKKILVQAAGALVCTLVGAAILQAL